MVVFEGDAGSARSFFFEISKIFFCASCEQKSIREDERQHQHMNANSKETDNNNNKVRNELSSLNNGGSLLNLNDRKEAI